MQEKVYVEFVGLPGSGKTTVMQALKSTLARGGKVAIIADEVGVRSTHGELFGSLAPALLFPLTTLRVLFFWLRHKELFYNTPVGSRELRERLRLVSLKRLLRDRFIFMRYSFDYFLCEGVLHPITFFNHNIDYALLPRLVRFVPPGAKRALVLVDLPPSVAFERMSGRGKKTGFGNLLELHGEAWGREYYAHTHENIEILFSYFSRGDGRFFTHTVRLDGTKSATTNAERLARELS